jgi:NAD(P)-dependent dehydrogenase (short-subunit alcohol dehydrogenase family)
VYYCARTFLPLLIASGDGVLINTSSVNGFWASLGPRMPNNAYATAKFAVKGSTEALIEDLRTNAPEVRVTLVMPGRVGTDIIANTRRAHGWPEPRQLLARLETGYREKAPLTAAAAAAIILDGCNRVPGGSWSARTPRRLTRPSAPDPRPPTTTPSWPKQRSPAFSSEGSRARQALARPQLRPAAAWDET